MFERVLQGGRWNTRSLEPFLRQTLVMLEALNTRFICRDDARLISFNQTIQKAVDDRLDL